jgi:hypothetical protein
LAPLLGAAARGAFPAADGTLDVVPAPYRAAVVAFTAHWVVAADLEADEPPFAQVSPGNARSLRAFLGAGLRPIGSEVPLP